MTLSIKQTLAACLIAALALPAAAQAQDAEQQAPAETVKATHGAWEIVCATAQPDLCVMRQVGTLEDGTRVLEVRVRKLNGVTTQDGQTVPAAIRILTPLGSLLATGVKVQIDGSQPRTGRYEVCLPQGCIVEDPVADEFLGSLKAGAVARMSFGTIQQQDEVAVDISLNGFTAAFNAL